MFCFEDEDLCDPMKTIFGSFKSDPIPGLYNSLQKTLPI